MNPALAVKPSDSIISVRTIGRLAQRALHLELQCYPKPGLVSPWDSGSHTDMDASAFLRSIAALTDYFPAIASAGAESAPFSPLQDLGRAAEQRMLQATSGANTHRGAVFHLGLLAAAAGLLNATGVSFSGLALGQCVHERWGSDIEREKNPGSHGHCTWQRHGVKGARHEAAAGFPHVFDIGLPALRASLARGADFPRAMVQCFFALMAEVEDTNLLYRGGIPGMTWAQSAARDFLANGGIFQPSWFARAVDVHRAMVARRLSPGGSADMLAAVLFVHGLQGHAGA